jgi:Tfp pilus assembly protein PilF
MIAYVFVLAAAASSSPAPTLDVQELVGGASHAVHANRLDQADLMLRRAIAAGATGPETDRVIADLAFAKSRYADALVRYESLLKVFPGDRRLIESAAIAALKLGKLDRASSLLALVKSQAGASWRLWNAMGVAADLNGEWAKADESYEEAIRIAPNEAAPINNRGWSMLLRGEWRAAVADFEQAALLDPKSVRAVNNLELARNALSAQLPGRVRGESDTSWAARLNDAGVAAAILGDKVRATAAFTQALDASGIWYERAANNLKALSER